jgi:hypothetical protein
MKQRSCYNQNMLSKVTQRPIVSGDGGMVLGSCERHDGGNVDHQYGRSDASSRPPSPGPLVQAHMSPHLLSSFDLFLEPSSIWS